MKFIPNAISSQVARAALHSQKASPQLLFAAGVVGMGATVVLACRATLKVEDVLIEHENKMEKVNFALTSELIKTETSYTEHDAKKDKVQIYIQTSVQLTRLYGPAIICGVLAVSSFTGAQRIMSKRNAALTAAFTSLQKAFDGYRDRTRAVVGEEREREIYTDAQMCEIEDENGKKTKKKVANGSGPYMFLFDDKNINWESTPEYNYVFLKLQQQYANDRLQAKGHLFLNEVLDNLGLERTKAGAVTGWIKGQGDNFVDFGIFRQDNEEQVLDFMVGREKALWLNFNVNGTIFDRI